MAERVPPCAVQPPETSATFCLTSRDLGASSFVCLLLKLGGDRVPAFRSRKLCWLATAGTGGLWPNTVCGEGILPCCAEPPHPESTWRGAPRLELLLACVDMADNESKDNVAIFSVCHSLRCFCPSASFLRNTKCIVSNKSVIPVTKA